MSELTKEQIAILETNFAPITTARTFLTIIAGSEHINERWGKIFGDGLGRGDKSILTTENVAVALADAIRISRDGNLNKQIASVFERVAQQMGLEDAVQHLLNKPIAQHTPSFTSTVPHHLHTIPAGATKQSVASNSFLSGIWEIVADGNGNIAITAASNPRAIELNALLRESELKAVPVCENNIVKINNDAAARVIDFLGGLPEGSPFRISESCKSQALTAVAISGRSQAR